MFDRFEEANTTKQPQNHRSWGTNRHPLTAVACDVAALSEDDTPHAKLSAAGGVGA